MDASEKSANATFSFHLASRWVGMRLDLTVAFFVIGTAAFCVGMKGVIDRELLTFSLQIITDLIMQFSMGIRLLAELQNVLVASQRVNEYT